MTRLVRVRGINQTAEQRKYSDRNGNYCLIPRTTEEILRLTAEAEREYAKPPRKRKEQR